MACLGGNEVFGKFAARPFPRLLADGLERECLNLGALNAGIDSFVEDEGVMRIADGGCVSKVVEILWRRPPSGLICA
jgi:hypothetical protein